jgi:hypothetical protein
VRIVEHLGAQTETERIEMTLPEDLTRNTRIVLLRGCLCQGFLTPRRRLAEMSTGIAKNETLREYAPRRDGFSPFTTIDRNLPGFTSAALRDATSCSHAQSVTAGPSHRLLGHGSENAAG